jgi:hypothetical protein
VCPNAGLSIEIRAAAAGAMARRGSGDLLTTKIALLTTKIALLTTKIVVISRKLVAAIFGTGYARFRSGWLSQLCGECRLASGDVG